MGYAEKKGGCEMEREELRKVLDLHEKWVRKKSEGARANLAESDLRGAGLQYANLQDAYLRDADLWLADLRLADLWRADLRGANLRLANFRRAYLRDANLRGTDLRGADIDYSAWPLWCGSLEAYIDDRIAIQLLYHLLRPVQASPYVSQEIKERLLTDDLIDLANRFHRAEECGEMER